MIDWSDVLGQLVTQFIRILLPVGIALILKWASELWLKIKEEQPRLSWVLSEAAELGYAVAEEYFRGQKVDPREKMDKDSEFVIRAYDQIEKYLITDLTVENISQLIGNFYDYEVLPVVTPVGSYTVSDVGVSQFHADEASLWDCVRTTFCA